MVAQVGLDVRIYVLTCGSITGAMPAEGGDRRRCVRLAPGGGGSQRPSPSRWAFACSAMRAVVQAMVSCDIASGRFRQLYR